MLVNVSREKLLEIIADLKAEGWANDEIAYFIGMDETSIRQL